MKIKALLAGAALAIATVSAAGAQASTLFSFASTFGPVETDNSATAFFNAPAGAGAVSFTLDGYASLDGQNYYEDDFSLILNGSTIFSGTWNLGGGGTDAILFNPNGGTANNISGNGTDVTWNGGHVLIDVPLNLVAGLNTLTFAYSSLPGPTHAGFQGGGDEAWGLSNITVTGGVPEPASWALMLVGFGGMGAMFRARRKAGIAAA
jgi:hypothetical protein